MSEAQPKYVICRLCGYIHQGSEGPEECPACGAPQSAFKPYKVKVEPTRLKKLELHIHPISTHFGVGGMVLLLIVFVFSLILPDPLGSFLGYGGVLDFFVYLQPLFVVVTAVAGYMDAKWRYKTVKTKYLKLKILLGLLLLVLTLFILIFHLLSSHGTVVTFVFLEGVFIFLGFGVAGILGFFGGKLNCNVVPRGQEGSDT